MYIAKITHRGITDYIIRESFFENGYYRSRDLIILDEHPAAYINYQMGKSFYIDTRLTDQLDDVVETIDYDALEELFWPYIRADIKRRFEFTRSRTASAVFHSSETEKVHHLFDKRRLMFLKGGSMNQWKIEKLDEKYFHLLNQKSRDEIEQYFMLMEASLPAKELKNYIYVIFDLQRHFRAVFAREMPAAIDPVKVERHFIDDICRVNRDTDLWQEMGFNSFLNDYLKRYVIMFFDNVYKESTYLNDREFEQFNRRRYHRQHTRPTDAVYADAARIFGKSENELKKMSKRELKKRFRKKAQELHPDKGGDHDTFVQLSKVFEELLLKKNF